MSRQSVSNPFGIMSLTRSKVGDSAETDACEAGGLGPPWPGSTRPMLLARALLSNVGGGYIHGRVVHAGTAGCRGGEVGYATRYAECPGRRFLRRFVEFTALCDGTVEDFDGHCGS